VLELAHLAAKRTRQGFGEHVPEDQVAPLPSPVHRDWVTRRQAPLLSVLQQAPGWSQVFGEHVPPKAQVCEVAPHADRSVMAHPPVTKLQQRPLSVHGSGEQVVEAIQLSVGPVH
jgi:hypothetical protein